MRRAFSVIGSGGAAMSGDRNGKPWTAEDDALLLAGYEANDSAEAIASALRRSKQAVWQRRSDLKALNVNTVESIKTDKAPKHRKHWRKKDKMRLRELVATNTPLAEIAVAVGRSERATGEQIRKLSMPTTRKTPVRAPRPRRFGKALLAASPAIAALVAFAIALHMGWLP
jgi:hypothetical protein